MSIEELKKLPEVSGKSKYIGKKDGEIKLFRNQQSAEVYSWKSSTQTWEKFGDVINQPSKKFYEGDKYFPQGKIIL